MIVYINKKKSVKIPSAESLKHSGKLYGLENLKTIKSDIEQAQKVEKISKSMKKKMLNSINIIDNLLTDLDADVSNNSNKEEVFTKDEVTKMVAKQVSDAIAKMNVEKNTEVSGDADEEKAELQAFLDSKGVSYNKNLGVAKLKELVDQTKEVE